LKGGNDKLKRISSIGVLLLVVSGLLLMSTIFLPWWGMTLVAPQYQEGLSIIVFPYKMEGELDIINNLNHYIGMKEFSEASFPELTYLPIIIGIIGLLTIFLALFRKRVLLFVWTGIVVIGSVLGVFDIYRWLKDFGTMLDPKAPIEIEPFIPPIVGKNQLANFETSSFFHVGAYIAGLAILIIIIVSWRFKENE
jgi:copper chaperone NosL